MRRTLPAALLALAVLALAACGGGDELTAEEYRAQARAICDEADRATDRLDDDQPTRVTPRSVAVYFRRLVAPNERGLERFARLEPPGELQDAHDEMLGSRRRAVGEVRRLIEQLEGGEDPRQVILGARERLQRVTGEVNAAAGRLGVPECGDRSA